MTIQDYFVSKISMLNLPITEDNLAVFLQSKSENTNAEITDYKGADVLFLEIILLVLAMPNVSEGDMSISYDKSGLIKFYRAECRRLGVKDILSETTAPKVRDMSFLA